MLWVEHFGSRSQSKIKMWTERPSTLMWGLLNEVKMFAQKIKKKMQKVKQFNKHDMN